MPTEQTLAFKFVVNGVNIASKDVDAYEKQLKKLKTSITDIQTLTAEFKKQGTAINSVAAQQKNLNQQERQWAKATQQELRAENEIRKTNAAIRKRQVKEAIDNSEIEKKSVIGMRLELERLKKEYYSLSEAQRNTTAGTKKLMQVQGLDSRVSGIEQSTGVYGRNVGNYRGAIKGAGMQLASNFSGGLIGNGAQAGLVAAGAAAAMLTKEVIAFNVAIDKQQGAVQKTTGLSAKAVDNVTEAFKKLDTTTSTLDLLKIAEEVGRFGVETEQGVIKTTQALNLLVMGLGDEFGGGVEQITTTVAQLSNAMYGATQDGELMSIQYLALGNVLNGLAQKGAASASGIADVATRIGGFGKVLGYTESQILGISSAMIESGINIERGAGAFERVNSVMRTNANEIGRFLGLTNEVWTEMLDTKPVEAFQTLVKKVREVSKGNGTATFQILKDLKINANGAKELFLKWGADMPLFSQRMEDANGFISNTNTLLRDQETLTNTVSGQWARLKNAVSDFFESGTSQEQMKGFLAVTANALQMSNMMEGVELTYAQKLKLGYLDMADKQAYIDDIKYGNINNKKSGRSRGGGRATTDQMNQAKIDEQKKKQISDYQSEQEVKRIEAEAKAREAAINKAERAAAKAEQLREQERARGKAGSVTRLKFQISELEQELSRESDAKLIIKYSEQLLALNKLLDKAEKKLANINAIIATDPNAKVNISKDVKPQFLLDFELDLKLMADVIAAQKELKALNFAERVVGKTTFSKQKGMWDPTTEQEEAGYQSAYDAYLRGRRSELYNDPEFLKAKEREDEKNFYRNEDPEDRAQRIKDQNAEAASIYESAAYETTDMLFQIWSNYYDRKEEKELSRLDKEYAKKIENAKGNATLELALQQELERKKEATQREYGKKRQRMAIVQANIDMAGAIVSAALTKPFVPAGLAAMIAAGVAGTFQIANIKSQKFAGGGFHRLDYSGGGFTPDIMGNADETGHTPVGIIHNGEWVGNRKFVRANLPLFHALESIQAKGYRPFAQGGFESPELPIPQLFSRSTSEIGSKISREDMMEMAYIMAPVIGGAVYDAGVAAGKATVRWDERDKKAKFNSTR